MSPTEIAPPENTADETETASQQKGSLSSVSFISLMVTQFLGAFNDNCFRWLGVAIAASVMDKSRAIGIGTICLTVPYLIFTPTAGWLADRFRKRSVIIGFKIAEIFIMLFGLLSILYGNVWMLFATTTLLGVQSSLFGPSKFGTIAEILPTRLLSKGNGLMAMMTIVAVGTGTFCGFALFGLSQPVLGSGDFSKLTLISAVMLGCAIVGTLSSLLIESVRPADPTRKPSLNPVVDIVPALQSLFADPRLIRTSMGIAFFMFLASLAQQNILPYGELVLMLEPIDVGILFGILIAGVACGSVLAGVWSEGKVELGIVPIGAFGIIGSTLLVFIAGSFFEPGLEHPKQQFAYWGSCIGLFLLGASAGLYDVPLEAYLQFRSTRKIVERFSPGAILFRTSLSFFPQDCSC